MIVNLRSRAFFFLQMIQTTCSIFSKLPKYISAARFLSFHVDELYIVVEESVAAKTLPVSCSFYSSNWLEDDKCVVTNISCVFYY